MFTETTPMTIDINIECFYGEYDERMWAEPTLSFWITEDKINELVGKIKALASQCVKPRGVSTPIFIYIESYEWYEKTFIEPTISFFTKEDEKSEFIEKIKTLVDEYKIN